MTNHLFQTPGFEFGMDLASINIQRGRDHGLPPYVRWREPCSLSPIKSFEDLDKVMSPEIVRKFRLLYSSVEDIDLFSAGLAEKSVVGGLVGPTFACIIGQQFSNLRRGDRFWYENGESESSFTAGQLQQIRRITLAQVLCRTMDGIETIQPFVFLATNTLKNRRLSCDDPIIGQLNLEFWTERPSEFRSYTDDPHKIKANISDSISKSKEENINSRRKVSNQAKIIPQQPFKGSVNQENKIVIKRPLGRPDNNNVTIMIQNNAVNSPVFINEGMYGSHIKIQQQPATKPISNLNQAVNNYRPIYRPQAKPIPTTIPHSTSFHSANYPYVPHAFDDPNNPNPLAYGYRSPAFAQDDVFYDNYSPTSPRPTLYTYYTNFQQKYTTQIPNHEIDGYLINYGSSYNNHDSHPHTYEKPLINSEHHELSDKQKSTQKPDDYVNFKRPTNAQSNFKPNYASNDESYHTHKTSYEHKLSTTMRPNYRPNYESYGTQKLGGTENVQNDNLSNKPNKDYQINSNKSQHQEQWNSNNYHVKPSERPYDYDDPDAYHKKPNVKPPSYNINNSHQTTPINRPNNEYNSQFWIKDSNKNFPQDRLYGFIPNSATNTPSYQKDTSTKLNTLFPTNHSNYDRYSNITSIYQKIPSTTQNNWMDVSSYITESSRPLQSDSFNPNNSPFNQKLTNYPIYQKDNQPPLSSYSKESINRPSVTIDPYKYDNSYKNPTKSPNLNGPLSSSTPYWLEMSTVGSQIHGTDGNLNPKPTKIQSVTIVTETLETVHHPGQSGYISQYKVTSEVPKPLAQQIKNNVPKIQKPGQYYYEKNVLYRYPDEIIDQIPKSNHYSADESREAFIQDRKTIPKSITVKTSIMDDSTINSRIIQSDENKLTKPILVITDNKRDDTISDLQRTFSTDIQSVTPADISDRYYFLNSIRMTSFVLDYNVCKIIIVSKRLT